MIFQKMLCWSVALLLVSCVAVKTPEITLDPTPPPVPTVKVLEPELVSVPSGSFIMGDQVQAGDADERPARIVNMANFQISKFELTFEEFDTFARATSRAVPDDNGWGRASRPVINVTFEDAVAYTEWLSDKTGKKYRLPTESEWEYAARGGALTIYANGNAAEKICEMANVADISAVDSEPRWDVTDCRDRAAYSNFVGSYQPNNYGLYDMHGNVWEWTLDCYQPSYHSAPEDGQAVSKENCETRVIRGGSFQLPAESARLSNREALPAQTQNTQVGFRIVLIP